MPRSCGSCQKELTGKQQRFCSNKCRSNYWNEARKRGEFLTPNSPLDETRSFVEDLFRLFRKHKEVIKTIIDE